MKKIVLLIFLCPLLSFCQEEYDTTYKQGLRFVHLQIAPVVADVYNTQARMGPEARIDLVFQDKGNFYFHARNAAWYDHAFANYANKQNIFNEAYSKSQKKYLNLEAAYAYNVYFKKFQGAIRAGFVRTNYILPLYYESFGKNFVAPYSIKKGINGALSDTLWTQNLTKYPGYVSNAAVYGVSTLVRNTDLFVGWQCRTGYDIKDKFFAEGDAKFSEYYIDAFYNLGSTVDDLVFGETRFSPQLKKLSKFGARLGFSKQYNLLFGFYFGAEAGIRPGYLYYDAEDISSSGMSRSPALNSLSLTAKIGFKAGAPTKTVKKFL